MQRARELGFLEAIRDDLRPDAEDLRGYLSTLEGNSRAGAAAVSTLTAERPCEDDCWRWLDEADRVIAKLGGNMMKRS